MAKTQAVVDDNGAWCWFQDERALVDPAGFALIGTVASEGGSDGERRGGDIGVIVADLSSGSSQTVVLHAGLESDDHDNPALWRRRDGRWLAVYSRHKSDDLTRWRISEPGDPTRWGKEQVFDWTQVYESVDPPAPARGVTYQNVHQLDGTLYCFVRAVNDDPCYLVSDDDGDTWTFGGRLLQREKIGYVNGYARYASGAHRGTDDRIDVIITEHHPRDFPTSIWHGYLADGALHDSAGNAVASLGSRLDEVAARAEDLTCVFESGSVWGGVAMSHAWTTDVRRGEDGRVVALFTTRADDELGVVSHRHAGTSEVDHRFFRAVLAPGGEWEVRELAVAGPGLLAHEQDYTGLASIDPDDLDAVYLSAPVDPRDGSLLQHHEVFHGRCLGRGDSWEWTPVTEGSDVDNFRPIAIPGDPARSVLTWYRGSMRSSQDYSTHVLLRSQER